MEFNKLVKQSVRSLRYRKGMYLNNPKAGCSTIKRTLIEHENSEGNTCIDINSGKEIHNRLSPIYTYEPEEIDFFNLFVFTFVRNPYSRVLSVYLDKIRGDTQEGREFRRKMGLGVGVEVEFKEFVKGIHSMMIWQDNPHWRKQCVNAMVGHIPISFVGYFESLSSDIDFVANALYGERASRQDWHPHATAASSKINEWYDQEIKNLVYEKYRDDFEVFGYDDNLSRLKPIRLERRITAEEYDVEKLRDAIAVARGE